MKPAALLWWLSCLPEAAAFSRATRAVEQTQHSTLRRILGGAAASQFGRAHEFSRLTSVDDFRQAVPLSDYEDYRPALERISAGQQRVLTGEPVRLFEPTSGTRGGSKLIPYTASLKAEFQRGVAAWIGDLLWHRPDLAGGRHYWSISPPPPRSRTSGRIPVGFEDDTSYLAGLGATLVRSLMAVPNSVVHQSDFQRATLEHLLACPDLVLVSVWSPTFWLLLMERLRSHYRLEPARVWPRLRCISCWGDGYSARYLPQLRSLHPQVWIQEKGLIATEALCTFPLVGRRGGALSLRSHFFEFLDAQERSRLAHEVECGGEYELVVTTGGGLYRYRLGDVVRVEGFLRQCPLLSFQGRRGGLVDRFGEKLSEAEVALHLPPQGLAMLAYEGQRGAYVLFAEGDGDSLRKAAHKLEVELRRGNFHYDHCRRLGQLGPVGLFVLEPGALAAYYGRLEQMGVRAGDLKPVPLRGEDDWSRYLPGRWL